MGQFQLSEFYNSWLSDPDSLCGSPTMALDDLVACISARSTAVLNEEVWQSLVDYHATLNSLSSESLTKLYNAVSISLNNLSQLSSDVLQSRNISEFSEMREVIEKFLFIVHLQMSHIDAWISEVLKEQNRRETIAPNTRRGLPSVVVPAISHIIQLLDSIAVLLNVGLDILLPTTAERDLASNLFLRPIFRLLEQKQLLKSNDLIQQLLRAICLSVKLLNQQTAVQNYIVQLLLYYEHLVEPFATLFVILAEQFDNVSLAAQVLKELGARNWNMSDTKSPKYASQFLVELTQLQPQLVVEHHEHLLPLEDTGHYALRNAFMEIETTVIIYLHREKGNVDKLGEYLDPIIARANDVNFLCRVKALQCLSTLCESPERLASRRTAILRVAGAKIKDKTQSVRRTAVKLIRLLVQTHMFRIGDNTQLDIDAWTNRLALIRDEIRSFRESTNRKTIDTSLVDSILIENHTGDSENMRIGHALPLQEQVETMNVDDSENQSLSVSDVLGKLYLMEKYHTDAIEFIQALDQCLETAELILRSRNKSDLLDTIDLFVTCDAYGVSTAKNGIHQMIHLVWAKANNDENNVIREHVVRSYYDIFLATPEFVDPQEAAMESAKNLVALTISASKSFLVSLQQFVEIATAEGLITPIMVRMLWRMYAGDALKVNLDDRRGAAKILGMISRQNCNVARSGVDTMIQILQHHGKNDFVLAHSTFVILQHVFDEKDWQAAEIPQRLPPSHQIFECIGQLLITPTSDPSWLAMAQEGIKAIADLCERPHLVFNELILIISRTVFWANPGVSSDSDDGSRSKLFAQLIFIVGDIAIKVLAHLDRFEGFVKRSRIPGNAKELREHEEARESITGGDSTAKHEISAEPVDEIDHDDPSAGTSEDAFIDLMMTIREEMLLFGERSLLARFAPMVRALCEKEVKVPHSGLLGISSTLTLAKFMCVSSKYCESNMQLLIDIANGSPNSVIRSNLVVAFGSMASCFNHIFDQHTAFIYSRLNDMFGVVQRTSVVTLTFLILAGQIKVKGQLSEMAKMLRSSDPKISSLARMFFNELASKEHAIYNSFLDMLSGLLADASLSEEQLKWILKYVMQYVDKEKQTQQLIGRVIPRLQNSESEREYAVLSFVLERLSGGKDEQLNTLLERGYQNLSDEVDGSLVAPA